MPKPRPDVPDADWESFKKDLQGQAYEAQGMADAVRKNYNGAADAYKLALSTESSPNPATMVRLAQAYMNTGKLGDATFTLDKAINTPNVPDQVKSIAQTMKNDIAKREAAAHPAAPAGGAAPAPGGSAAPANPPANSAPPAANPHN